MSSKFDDFAAVIKRIEMIAADLFIVGVSLALFGWMLYCFSSCITQPTRVFAANLEVNPIQGIDYMKHLSLASLARKDPKHVYDLQAQLEWINSHIAPGYYKDIAHSSPSHYTPPLVALLEPFDLLPSEKGYVIFTWSQVIAAILVLNRIIRLRSKPLDWCYFWLLILASPAGRQSICLGQTVFILTAILGGFYIAWKKDKQILAGMLVALFALAKPHHCLIPGVMMLVKRQWKAIASMIVTTILLYTFAGLMLGFDVVASYPHFAVDVEHRLYEAFYAPRDICINLRCILGYVVPAGPLVPFGYICSVFIAIYAYAVWKRALRYNGKVDGLAFFITLTLSFIFGLHAYFYDLVLLAVPFALSVNSVGVFSAIKNEAGLQRLWALCFIAYWFGSQVLSVAINFRIAQNWHCAYNAVFCIIAMVIFYKSTKNREVEPAATVERDDN